MTQLGLDGRELRPDVRTGIRRYLAEVLRAASHAGWACTVYGDAATRLELDLPGVSLRILPGWWTHWWDQVTLPRALARDGFIGYAGRRRPFYDAAMTWVARLYARRASAIIADAEYSKRAIVARLGIAPAKVTVIPVALGAEFRPQPLTDAVKLRYGIASPRILVTAAGLEVVELGFDRGAAATRGKRLVNDVAYAWFRLTGLHWRMAFQLVARKPGTHAS